MLKATKPSKIRKEICKFAEILNVKFYKLKQHLINLNNFDSVIKQYFPENLQN